MLSVVVDAGLAAPGCGRNSSSNSIAKCWTRYQVPAVRSELMQGLYQSEFRCSSIVSRKDTGARSKGFSCLRMCASTPSLTSSCGATASEMQDSRAGQTIDRTQRDLGILALRAHRIQAAGCNFSDGICASLQDFRTIVGSVVTIMSRHAFLRGMIAVTQGVHRAKLRFWLH